MLHNVIINYTRRILGINKKRLFPSKMRSDDVWLVSFPKSGNTWVRFILGNLMIDYCKKGTTMNFNTMQNIVPDIYLNKKIPLDIGFSPFPRIIKSHEKYTKKYKRSIYVIRDPKDAMVSYYHFMKDGHNKNIKNFSEFLKDEKLGIDAWCKNVKSWIGNADVIIKFEDLKINPEKEIKKILELLKIKIDEEKIRESVRKSSFDKMKELENKDQSWKEKHNLNKNYSFMRKGTTEQGKKYFRDEDINYFNEIIAKNGIKGTLKKLEYEKN